MNEFKASKICSYALNQDKLHIYTLKLKYFSIVKMCYKIFVNLQKNLFLLKLKLI